MNLSSALLLLIAAIAGSVQADDVTITPKLKGAVQATGGGIKKAPFAVYKSKGNDEDCRAKYSRCGLNGGVDLGECCPDLECVQSQDGYGNSRRRCE